MKSTPTPWWAQGSGTHLHPAGAFSRRSLRAVAIRTIVTFAVIGGLCAAALGTEQPRMRNEATGVSLRQSTDSLLGGCGRVFERKTPPGTAGVVPSVKADGSPNIATIPPIVPMTGPFWSPPADPRLHMYTAFSETIPEPTRLLHNMWSGALVVYFTTTADPADVRTLTDIAATRADLFIIVVPWDATRGDLPAHRKIAFATWGASQTCQRLAVVALEQFRSAHPQGKAPGYGGAVAPTLSGTAASLDAAR